MDKAQERDWTPWIPRQIGRDRVTSERFRVGQIWAYSNSVTGVRAVLEVVGADNDADTIRWLAGYHVGRSEPWRPGFGPAYSVLVQDVGQPEPTPPEVLFRLAPKHEESFDGLTWILVPVDDGFSPWHRVNGVVARRPPVAIPTSVAQKPPAVVAPKRRVSANGRDFVDYDSLIDADPFDAYKWRMMLNADGSEYSWRPGANAVEREQAWALHLHGEKEVAFKMENESSRAYRDACAHWRLEAMIASEKAEPVRRVAPSCAPMLFGGIVRLR